MQTSLRKAGIEFLGDMAWGSHLCLFFETKQDLLETALPFFRAGLEDNEFCLWAVSEPLTVEDAKAALREGIPDFDEYLAAGSIEIISGTEWYLKDGQFKLKRVTGGWNEKLNTAMNDGYSGMRASGNAFWMNTKRWQTFVEYEQELDRALAGEPVLMLCTYAIPKSRAADLLDVVKAHEITVARRRGAWEVVGYTPVDQAKPSSSRVQDAAAAIDRLTPREREVLSQLSHGAKTKEIATRLGISERTVDVYRSRILLKTKARNLPELVRMAIAGGIDEPTPRKARSGP
jgi:DNA-binding CsgD family transcriptional regulator